VLTFPVALLPSNLVMISTIIRLKKIPVKESQPTEANLMQTASFDMNSGAFAHSFITTFKDCKGFYGKTHFTDFPDWMGMLRELVLAPIGNELLKDLGSGQFGMVTNASDIKILNDADTLNKITGNLWITEKSDFENSFIDLNFEFLKTNPETGSLLKLADCQLSTTWVTIEGRGIVKKSPIPKYFMDFLNKHISKQVRIDKSVNDTSYPAISEMGKAIYENKNAIRPQILIVEKEFQTGISNGNTVGNLYYSNYYTWQSKILEQFLFQISPDIMTNNGRSGEFLTLAGNVQHLQEAMPFESIVVMMYLEKVFENGLTFYFEYFSKQGKEKRKLAYGSNSIIWCRRLFENSAPEVQPLPQNIAEAVFCLTSLGIEFEKMLSITNH
jgi:acyl-CoA thioesterase FadM